MEPNFYLVPLKHACGFSEGAEPVPQPGGVSAWADIQPWTLPGSPALGDSALGSLDLLGATLPWLAGDLVSTPLETSACRVQGKSGWAGPAWAPEAWDPEGVPGEEDPEEEAGRLELQPLLWESASQPGDP